MDATVYIWGRHSSTGHASIEFASGRYISFSPLTRNQKERDEVILGKRFPYVLNEIEEDKANRQIINKIPINFLRLDLINNYLLTRSEADFPHYCLYDHNCSAVVAKIIFEGAGVSLDPHKTLHGAYHSLKARFHHGPLFEQDPDRLVEGIRAHVEEVLGLTYRMALTQPIIRAFYVAVTAVDVATRVAIWTPGAVEALAEDLSKNHR